MADSLPWDDPGLKVRSDSRRTATYRLLQSWYRHHVLHAPYRTYRARGVERPCGSLLATGAVADTPGLNFLSDAATDYAATRADEVIENGGTLEVHRLRHNMLSSMPLCFSIFGELRAHPDSGLPIVTALFDPNAVAVEAIECEWKPDTNPLADRTAFDAMIITRHRDGTRHLIGVETKYTEPFSPKPYSTDAYTATHQSCGWFHPGTETDLVPSATNQLWRNTLLAAAGEINEINNISSASVCVVALDDDTGAATAIAGLRTTLRAPDQRLRFVTLQELANTAAETAGMSDWAQRLTQRYIDTEPVQRPR